VIGATAFLGTNIVYELLKDGWDVRAFGLPGSNSIYIKKLPIELSGFIISLYPGGLSLPAPGISFVIMAATLIQSDRFTNQSIKGFSG